MSSVFDIQVRTLTGLESLLAEEVRQLGGLEIRSGNRIVFCRGDLRTLYRINLGSRTAIRVLRPVLRFSATSEQAYYEGIQKFDWRAWIKPQQTFAVDAQVYSSFLSHSLYLAQKTKDAIVDQFLADSGVRPSVDRENPDVRITVRLMQNEAEISLDASGESLHRRGYRTEAGLAPLNEALAAGFILKTGWRGECPLLDAMAGAGTLAIEAGLILQNRAPGLLRTHFSFQNWPDFSEKLYQEVRQELEAQSVKKSGKIIAVEKDPEVALLARANVKRAGLEDVIDIYPSDFFEFNPGLATGGILVLNPPYDERLAVGNVAAFYREIGDRLKEVFGGWRAFLLTGNLEAAKAIGLRSSRRETVFNGGLECRILEFEIRPGGRTLERRDPPAWNSKAEVFRNRLRKNFRHLSRQARRQEVSTFRLYDWDIPELPFVVDVEGDKVKFREIPRNYDHSPADHPRYLKLMQEVAEKVVKGSPN